MIKLIKNKGIWIIIVVGILLRLFAFENYSKYDDPDGYVTFARSLYTVGAHGYDKQYYEENKYPDLNAVFKNNPNPVYTNNKGSVILTSHYAIGWPLQMYCLYKISGGIHLQLVQLYQILLSIGIILFFYKIGVSLFNIEIGLIAAFICAVNPVFILDAISFTTETSFLFFISLAILFFIRIFKSFKWFDIFIWSIVIGIATLIRPVGFLYMGSFVLLAFIFSKFNIRLLVAPFIFFLILSPWILRNYNSFNRFIPLTSFSGVALFEGNNKYIHEEKSGTWSRHDGIWVKDNVVFGPKDDCYLVGKKANVDAINYLKSLSAKELLLHEWYKLKLGFGLSYIYLFKSPDDVNQYKKHVFNDNPHQFTLKNKIIYYPIFILSLIYLFVYIKRSNKLFNETKLPYLIIIITGIGVYLFHTLLFFAFMRYRSYLLDPYLILMASVAIYFIGKDLKNYFLKIN